MEKPKPFLRNIRVDIIGDENEVKGILDTFSRRARHVESLSVICHNYAEGTFDKFVDSNKTTLSYVSVDGRPSSGDGISTLKAFLESSALREIRGSCRLPEYMLKRLRNRRVFYRRV